MVPFCSLDTIHILEIYLVIQSGVHRISQIEPWMQTMFQTGILCLPAPIDCEKKRRKTLNCNNQCNDQLRFCKQLDLSVI
jgi:hypothetical protein